jgi:imidazolonepropionase-like amidohydrolase
MKRWTMILMILCAVTAMAHNLVPGAKQSHPVLLKGGDLYTVKNGVLQRTDLLFEQGRISQIGKDLSASTGTEVIDVTGKRVYPGLIDAATCLGLVEIGEVRATRDASEVGAVTPEVQSHIAYNPDSEIIPTVRANGITTALVAPTGGVICGRSSLINLDGWTKEDATEKFNIGLHINWPSASTSWSWTDQRPAEEKKKDRAEKLKRLDEAFEAARAYYLAKKANPNVKVDERWEAMLPVFSKELTVFVNAEDVRQITQAVDFAKKWDIRIAIVNGRDSYKVTDLLNTNGISVVYGRTQGLPMREDEDPDISSRVPGLLADAGVKFCLSSSYANSGSRNLPFQAAQAVAFGLAPDQALRALTLSSAEILGVDKDLGSLEVGKKATIIVSDGDILDPPTNKVVYEFIDGRKVDLNNRGKQLYDKYRQKLSTR